MVLVDRLSDDQFVDPPDSPPAMLSSQDSTDSLTTDVPSVPTPVNAQETARNNIIREMVETERKYVQDLEIMQVRPSSLFIYFVGTHLLHRNTPMHCRKAILFRKIQYTFSFRVLTSYSISSANSSSDWKALPK